MLNVTGVPAFADNYIWLARENDHGTAIIVDPGDACPVLATLETLDLQVAAIFITHHHRDHTGGIQSILARHPAPVYGPATENIPGVTHPVQEGDQLAIAGTGMHFTVLDVPGHTRGHVAYVGHGCLFCGDTLFSGGCGRLFEGTAEQMHASLAKIAALPPDTRVYCAHEYTEENLVFARVVEPNNPALIARQQAVAARRAQQLPTVPSQLDEELQTNPFLRSHEPVVIAAAENFANRSLPSGAEVFGVVRHWKDTLD